MLVGAAMLLSACQSERGPQELAGVPSDERNGFVTPVDDFPVQAGPPPELTVTDLQPSDGDMVLLQPLARLSNDAQDQSRWQLNMDVTLTNETEQNIWLNSIDWDYPQAAAPGPMSMNGLDLLNELDEPRKKRSLYGNGWRVFGAHSGSVDNRQGNYAAVAVRNNTSPNQFVVAGRLVDEVQPRFAVFRLRGSDGTARTISEPLPLPAGAISEATAVTLLFSDLTTTAAAGVMVLNGERSIVVALMDTENLTPRGFFGDLQDDNIGSGFRIIQVPGADIKRVAGIDQYGSNRVVVLAEVESGGRTRSVLIGLNFNGSLNPNFGQNGFAFLPNDFGNGEEDVTPAALVGFGSGGARRLFVAASVGDACHHNDTPGSCRMLVRRHENDGSVGLGYGTFGSVLIDFPGAATQGANALVLDTQGRAFVGGWAQVNENGGSSGLRWAAAKLDVDGALDKTWGQGGGNLNDICLQNCSRDGRVMHRYSGSFGIITALALRNNNELVASGWARHPGKQVLDIATGVYTPFGDENWGNWALTHIPDFDGFALASDVAVTGSGTVVAFGSGNRNIDDDMQSGSWQASVRFRPDGRLDSLLNFAPGGTRELKFPESRLSDVALSQLNLRLHFRGGASQLLNFPIEVHNPANLPQGYLFPLDELDANEFYVISQQHLLHNNHRQSRSQKFAYDVVVRERNRATGQTHRTRIDPATGERFSGTENDHSLVWGKPVRAAEDGTILICFSLFPDNPRPGEELQWVKDIAGGGNLFWIQHDSGELALYAHFMEATIPESLCPRPASNDPADQGANNLSIRVRRGQFLGQVGNSGASSDPHLHFHMQENRGDLGAGNSGSGLPALFANELEFIGVSRIDEGKGFVSPQRQSLPPEILIRPN